MNAFASRFLVEPARFAEGEPFGDERLRFRIAECELDVTGLSSEQSAFLGSRWHGFISSARGENAVPIDVRRAAHQDFREFDKRGWEYVLDMEHGTDETRLAGYDLVGRLAWRPELAGTLWTSAEEPEVFRGAFENFVRVLLAHATLARGGVLVHSAAVFERGEARLFVGPSGAGKSTVGRLALESGREVASDDLNPIAPVDGAFRVCGSPFLGDVGSLRADARPLVGIYRLEKGTEDALRPMRPAEAAASLVSTSPFVNQSPYLSDRLWTNVVELVRTVPAYVLAFRREGTFWPLLQGS